MQSSDIYAIATLLAIVLGPVLAVLITRHVDSRSESHGRKLNVFRNLMQTRGLERVAVIWLHILRP